MAETKTEKKMERRMDRKADRRKERSTRKSIIRSASVEREHQVLRFERKNWILFTSGLACVALGFLFLRFGDITLAPILLLSGYLVLIPWSLVARSRQAKQPEESEAGPAARG